MTGRQGGIVTRPDLARDPQDAYLRLYRAISRLSVAGEPRELLRSAVEAARDDLGFDRVGVWLRDPDDPCLFRGTFGVDESGGLRDERYSSYRHELAFIEAVAHRPEGWLREENAELGNHQGQAVGRGQIVHVQLPGPGGLRGMISADNLLTGQPFGDVECVLLALFGLTVGHHLSRFESAMARSDSEWQLAAVFRNAAAGIFIISNENKYIRANRRWCEMLGYSADELMRLDPAVITHPDDYEQTAAGGTSMYRGEIDSYRMEKRYVRRDGSTFWAEVSAGALRRPDGQLHSVLGVAVDITERREALRRLAESEARYRGLIDNARDAVWRLDLTGRVTFANSLCRGLLGYGAEELIGRSAFDLLTEDGERRAREAIRDLTTPNALVPQTLELGHRRKDGTEFLGEVRTTPIRNEAGEVVEVQGVTRDVTEERKTQEALRQAVESEREFREKLIALHEVTTELSAVRSADELCRLAVSLGHHRLGFARLGIWFLDAATNSIVGSFGIDEEGNIRDERAQSHVLPEDGSLRRMEREHSRWTMTGPGPLENHHGETVGQGWNVQAPLWDGERVIGNLYADSLGMDRPYTEREADVLVLFASALGHMYSRLKVEDELRVRHNAIDSALHGIAIIDPEGRLTYANQAYLTLFGYDTLDDLLGRSVEDLYQSQGKASSMVEDLYRSSAWAGELVGQRRDGTSFDARVSASLIREPGGQPICLLAWVEDITEAKRAQEEQEQLEAQIHQAQKMESLAVLAGGVAHDFNNIMMGVIGSAQLSLMRLSSDSDVRPLIEQVESSAWRAANLAQQMLAYAGRGRFVNENVDLSAVVRDMRGLLASSVSKKTRIVYDLTDPLPALEGDPVQVEQIAMNLVLNASEALEERDGTVTVTTAVRGMGRSELASRFLPGDREPGAYVILEVRDTGIGMDEQTRARVFDPFYSTKFTGRGLGLAAVLGIVRGHGGAIAVESTPGKGTTFTVALPADSSATTAEPQPESPSHAARASADSALVLIADDDEMVRRNARTALELAGYTTLVAEDGHKALELFQRNADEVDLLLLDMMMPGLGGDEVYAAVRNTRPDVPVILCSGYDEGIVDSSELVSGRDGISFLHKPYALREMVAEVSQRLAR
jgi:PAS domain S-box-containing protein